MAAESQPVLVQAVYSFKGKNNDELCFKKGDIITVTQMEEGGWWEGTFGEKTGWFPSNYVKEYRTQNSLSPVAPTPLDLVAQQKVYRSVVLKDLIDSERAHVTELQGLMKNFLRPLENAEIMKTSEYQQLIGNLPEVVEVHETLLASLEEIANKAAAEQRVGNLFLTTAPRLKQVHMTYCSSHPRAVCILDRYKQELSTLMEANGAASPGLLVLTTGLSKPFRRLDKYAGMLTEMERHVEEAHIDRGDTQRSVSVYKDIASACCVMRRQKEMELEVVSGGVRGWEGEDLTHLGDILHMGSVAVGPDHRDRYLVLFPTTLLMLSVSQRMSAFIYEGKLPLTGISINKLEDTESHKNAFEIAGPMIERIVAICQTKEDQQMWVDTIRQQIRSVRVSSPSPTVRPQPPPHNSMVSGSNINRPWSVSCLRPSPPLRFRDDKSSRNFKKTSERGFDEDAQILRVIEAYCTSAKTRYTVNSVDLSRLDLLPPQACNRCNKTRRASTWCCGHFVLRTLTKAHFE
ncbi:rho guanine nucleotide exchange factor 7 isoform X3 [Homalodisca vitripennis]|uniref:rho guanine nucleotide exchange factor 7 isoform X3 n=1 Tax=Homalodisca vitripennis TaxID=197043 RepID=UPI001EEC9756|nr:rho guanine nucleotide exchange factor 7 isoform X3 [Homalodisca vitripennis]